MTFPADAALQDRQAEAILRTLVELGPRVLQAPADYSLRANLMWCATQALNGLIGCGVPQDWTSHAIGHELTARYGLDHAQSLAVLLPAVWQHQKAAKAEKLAQYADRVWDSKGAADPAGVAIEKTIQFFHSLGLKTRLSAYGIPADRFDQIGERFVQRGLKLGEHQNLGKTEIIEILRLCQ